MDPRPLRLLSLGWLLLTLFGPKMTEPHIDGGGVKGLTSLLLLQQVFVALETEVGHAVQPYEYFDLIGGTSTGG